MDGIITMKPENQSICFQHLRTHHRERIIRQFYLSSVGIIQPMTKKEPRVAAGLFFCQLVANCDVGRLGSFRTLFDNELDLLTFGQVAETVTLNGGEMDENVLSTFALDKAEALITIEPFDGTSYSFRHCLPPMASKKF